jgi:hypothetical protein
MENEENQVQSTTTQEDAILPDGWDGTTDFFAWAAGDQADEPTLEQVFATEESGTEESEEAPTTGTETEENGESEAETEEAPTTQPESVEQPSKIKFDANINHKVQSVEIDQSELPDLYQKAYAAEKFRKKLNEKTAELEEAEVVAKILGYDNAKAMLAAAKQSFEDNEIERLTSEKVHPTIAKDTVSRKIREIEDSFAKNRKAAPVEVEEAQEEEPAPSKAGQRDFSPEVADLLEAYPELRGKTLPKEVVEATLKGQTLTVAYTKYLQKQTKADNDRLQKENKTLKQNAEAAKRAPVRGVAKGGATGIEAEDPFLKGFNS